MKTKTSIALAISICSLCINAQTPASTSATDQYETLVAKALESAGKQDYDAAQQYFRNIITTYPNDHRNALIYMNMGKVYELQKHLPEAIEAYSKAINQYPENVSFLTTRAQAYISTNNYRKAILDFTEILTVDPKNTDALSYRGYAHNKLREPDKAKADYAEALAIDPENYMALFGDIVAERMMSHNSEAINKLNALIDTYDDKAELYSVRAEIESDARQFELALADLDKAIALEPNNQNYTLTRAYLHLTMNNKRLARKDFERAIELGIPQSALKEELKKCR